ncbi:MAG: hypothetical protein HZA46_03325 [Planctomycetales bacterium]|nr:hypothetical protein [Planctomycetales bacterium]
MTSPALHPKPGPIVGRSLWFAPFSELAIDFAVQNGDDDTDGSIVRAIRKNSRETIEDAEYALRLGQNSPRFLYNAARIHVQAAGASDLRVSVSIDDALDLLADEWRSKFSSTQIHTDAAWDAIRKHPWFLQMEIDLLSKK